MTAATLSLSDMITAAQSRQAEREAEIERKAIEDWNKQVAEWKAQYRREASEAFGADFMQQLAPKLITGRDRRYEIRGVITYQDHVCELTCSDNGWFWKRVDDETARDWNVGPTVLVEIAHRMPVEERQDRLLCGLAELITAPALVTEECD